MTARPTLVYSELVDALGRDLTARINAEIEAQQGRGHFSPTSILAGVLLSLYGLIQASPQPRPGALADVEQAVKACLDELLAMSDAMPSNLS